MNMLMRGLTLTVLGALFSAVPAHAQGGGTGTFKWYVGGHGGVLGFRTPLQGRQYIPAAGGHVLITAKRTGLLLSVDQAFGDDELTMGAFEVTDSAGNVVSSGPVVSTFQGIRKYSAILLAYPIRNQNIQPFVGLGFGILHTTTNSPGPFAGNRVEGELGTAGFGTAVGGIEFRAGPVSAFGMLQLTTKSGYKEITTVVETQADGSPAVTRVDFGEWLLGATHTLVGGLRFSLGSARENPSAGGY